MGVPSLLYRIVMPGVFPMEVLVEASVLSVKFPSVSIVFALSVEFAVLSAGLDPVLGRPSVPVLLCPSEESAVPLIWSVIAETNSL